MRSWVLVLSASAAVWLSMCEGLSLRHLQADQPQGNPFEDDVFREAFKEAGKGGFIPLIKTEKVEQSAQASSTSGGAVRSSSGAGSLVPNNEFNFVVKSDLNASVDWRNYGFVSDVKFQGPCGVCWAFVATGMIESRYAADYGTLISLSEQQFIDCNDYALNDGCNGGNFFYALRENDEILRTAQAYPFLDGKAEQKKRAELEDKEDFCDDHYTEAPVMQLSASKQVKFVEPLDEETLMYAVEKYGPIGIALSAFRDPFMKYTGGVFSHDDCGDDVDHAALLVGYGTDPATKEDYWIIKNSWGPAWGEDGYMRLKRAPISVDRPFGECGIYSQANYLEPGSVECVNEFGCTGFENKLFCSATYGCETEQFYASKFFIDTDGFLRFGENTNGGSNKNDILTMGSIIGIAVGSVLVIASVAYFVYARNFKTHLNMKPSRALAPYNAEEPSQLSPKLAEESPYCHQIEPFRERLAEIDAFKKRAYKDRDAVLLMYLEQTNGDVNLAVQEYMQNE